MPKAKKSILLIGDMPGWAFDNIIDFVRKKLAKDYFFYYDYTIYNPRKTEEILSDEEGIPENKLLTEHLKKRYASYKFPFIKSVAYKTIGALNHIGFHTRDAEGRKRRVRKDNQYDCVIFLDYYMDRDGDFDHIKAKKIIRGIYTDGFPPRGFKIEEKEVSDFLIKYFQNTDALLAGANSILENYKPHASIPCFEANMAYDEDIFRPKSNIDKTTERKLVVGWTGSPNRAFKGYHELIAPAVEALQREGLGLELRSQFSGTLNSLADFWQQVDVALIASEADAGPSLFMEASLCGVPSISTRIGMPAYVIEHEKNGLFIERNQEALKAAIQKIYYDRDLLRGMSNRIREDYIAKLGVEVQVKNWQKLFQLELHA